MSIEASGESISNARSVLPTASYDDMLHGAFDTEDDPQHRMRWLEFQDEQPVLAQEVLDSMHSIIPETTARKQAIDQITLIYAGLKNAVTRNKASETLDPVA